MVKSTRRSIDVPCLSITVPPPEQNAAEAEVSKQVPATIPHQKIVSFLAPEKDSEHSDAESSICHSPSWEGYGQRKKEKKLEEKQRRKERERAEKEAKEAKKKLAARLTKMPPPTKALHSERSVSVPPSLASTKQQRPFSERVVGRQDEEETRLKHSEQRSDLITARLHHSSLTQSPIAVDKGFIGGLKLEQERRAATQRAMKLEDKTKKVAETLANDAPAKLGPLKSPPPPPPSQVPELPRLIPNGPPLSSATTQQPLRHKRRHKVAKEAPPISIRSASLKTQPLISPTAPEIPDLSKVYQWRERSNRKIMPQSSDLDAQEQGTANIDVVTQNERGRENRQSEGYVRHQRQQSAERAISGFADETRVSKTNHYPPSASKPQSHEFRSYSMHSESKSASILQAPRKNSLPETKPQMSPDNDSDYMIASNQSYAMPTPELTLVSTSDGDIKQSSKRGDKGSSRLSMRNFKDAAKAALKVGGSHSRTPSSSSVDIRPRTSPPLSVSGPPSIPSSSVGHFHHFPKPARLLGEFNELTMRSQQSNRPSDRSSISSYEESIRSPSTATTPDSSRPQSEKGLPPVAAFSEVEKGTAANPMVADDLRTLRGSHHAVLATDSAPDSPVADRDFSRFMDDHSSIQQSRPNSPEASESEEETWRESTSPIESGIDLTSNIATLAPEQLSYTSCAASLGDAIAYAPTDEVPEASSIQEQGAKPVEDEPTQNPSLAMSDVQRAPSLTKSRSSPELVVDMSFLPKLKHQPLMPPGRHKARQGSVSMPCPFPEPAPGPSYSVSSSTTSASPLPSAAPSGAAYLEAARKLAPAAPAPRPRGASASVVKLSGVRLPAMEVQAKVEPMAKMFVECCNCKFFHDMPSKVYECMVNPDTVVEDRRLGVSGAITTMVKCPWCSHGMTTRCCAGYAAVVYLKEKLH
jgi:hypothetical protein